MVTWTFFVAAPVVSFSSGRQIILGNSSIIVSKGASLEFNNRLELHGDVEFVGDISLNHEVITHGDIVRAAAGALVGTGPITADFRNEGAEINPGDGIGRLTVAGDFWQSAEGTLTIEIESSQRFDRLYVTQDVWADGQLNVTLDAAYRPRAGDTFDVLDFDALHGEFAIGLPPLAAPLAWDSSRLHTDGMLAIVPESSALHLAAFFACTGLLGRPIPRSRRR